jgi:hypothetical protein
MSASAEAVGRHYRFYLAEKHPHDNFIQHVLYTGILGGKTGLGNTVSSFVDSLTANQRAASGFQPQPDLQALNVLQAGAPSGVDLQVRHTILQQLIEKPVC